MITSLILVRLQELLKDKIIPITLLGMGAAFTFLSFTNSIPLVIVSVCLIGFGQGILFPIIILKAMDCVAPHQSDQVVAITASFTFLGQFLSSVVLDGFGKLFHTSSIRFQYGVLSIGLLIVLVSILTFRFTQSNQRNRKKDYTVRSATNESND